MTKKYSTTAGAILFISIVLSSCSSTNLLTMSVTEPAPVNLASNIKTIGIIDRSMPFEKNEIPDKLDKLLSAEGKDLDKEGAHESVVGLYNELLNNTGFSKVKIIDNADVRSPGLGILPAVLPWKTIEQVCNKNNVDALFVLSFYDTDAKIDYKAVQVEVPGPFGTKIPAIEQQLTITTFIKTGWRIYETENKFIPDEYLITEKVISTGRGINPVKAFKAIIDRKEAVLQVSNNIGRNYAIRILPYNIRVSRNYYVRGTDNFKIAKRRAQTGNWNGAAELWEKEISNPKGKVAGRACYNMAIINEINGDLDAAVEWASKSYTDYRDKMALRYLNVLKRRIEKNKQLQ